MQLRATGCEFLVNSAATENEKKGGLTMLIDRRFKRGAFVFLFAVSASLPTSAQAITADVAKKCNALMEKQFPPRQPGNPAAGSSKGSAKDQRDYFKKCVDNDGNPEGNTDKKGAPN